MLTSTLRLVITPPFTKASNTTQNKSNSVNNTATLVSDKLKKVVTTLSSVMKTGKNGSLSQRNINHTVEYTLNVVNSRVPTLSYSFEYIMFYLGFGGFFMLGVLK